MIHWQTDPMLFDLTPADKNQWLTANKLVEQQAQSKIFLSHHILNLYSIMVRKIDFQSGERLLQRFPYITLPNAVTDKLRVCSLSLAEKYHYYFRNTALDYSIKKWQTKIINYLENQKRLPFPLFRLSEDWLDFLKQEYVPFQSARGEQFHLPTKLSADLAYFLGVVIGDGHLNYHNIVLVDFSKEHMEMIQALAKSLFGIEGTISGEEKCWLLHLNNKWLVRLVNFFTNQPIEGKKYDSLQEPLILHFDELLRRHFWSGVLDADGSYKKEISLCSKSRFFVQAFGSFLMDHNIPFKIRKLKNSLADGYTLKTSVLFKKEIGSLLLPRHIRKLQDFQDYISSKTYRPRKKHEDYLSELQNKNKDLRFKSFNQDKILSEESKSFFDFSLLPQLGVLHSQKLLKDLRIHLSWTQHQLADYLSIPKKMLTTYENSSDITIQLLEKLLSLFPEHYPKSLMVFLQKFNLTSFRSRKTVTQLPLQPSEVLLALLKNLELRRGYLFIQPKDGRKEIFRSQIARYFNIPKPTGYKLSNSVIYLFTITFCKL